MPFSIPTALAVKFVTKNSLQKRIQVLQNSYKVQITGLGALSSFEVLNNTKLFLTNNQPIFKALVYTPLY